jgi:OOP family OmpA-OmpF porin
MSKNTLLISLAAVSTLGLSLPTFAVPDCSGVYIGGQAGYAGTNYNLSSYLDKHFNEDGYAGRVYLGYQFNQFLGLETGFTLLSDADLPKDFGDIRTTHWDLLLKAGAPLGDSGFRGDVKAGGAHVMTKFDASHVSESLGLNDVSNWKIKPVAGASISYNFNRNVAVDVSYLHVFGEPKGDSIGAPRSDLAMLGLSFLFPTS